MGGVPIKHHTRSKVGRRRSQMALKKQQFGVCKNCGGPTMHHRACPTCGQVRAVKNSVQPETQTEQKQETQS